MAVIEGGVSGALTGVGAESFSAIHTVRYPVALGAGGAYRMASDSGTMAASLAGSSEIFQFRYVTAASRLALVYKVSISASLMTAATAAAGVEFMLTSARAWTVAGTGGTRLSVVGNNCKLRTSYASSEVADAGIATTGALTAGTKTLDTTNMGGISMGLGTGAITTTPIMTLQNPTALLDADGEGQHPLVLANQEGFVIRSGTAAWPAGATWHFCVNVLWLEVPAF